MKQGEYDILKLEPHQADRLISLRKEGLQIRDCISVQSPQKKILVFLVRKPSSESTSDLAVRSSLGCLHIGKARIGTEERENQQKEIGQNLNQLSRPNKGDSDEAKSLGAYGIGAKQKSSNTFKKVTGRWPSNLIFKHGESCKIEGQKTVGQGVLKQAGSSESKPLDDSKGWNQHSMTRQGQTAPENYGTETVPSWNCQPDCPVKLLDEQSGDLYSASAVYGTEAGGNSLFGTGQRGQRSQNSLDATGGASRFFYQAVSENDLNVYLETLLRG